MQFTFALYALAFCIPLFLNSVQLVTGSLVNCLLFLAAIRLSKKEAIPVAILPGLGAISHGVLFGPQTVFLYYFLPFIWIGNYMLILLFTAFQAKPYGLGVGISAIGKYLVLQLFANLYFRIGVVPAFFVSSMGYMQIITALAGGLLAIGISHERR
jgi:hypothetical protein